MTFLRGRRGDHRTDDDRKGDPGRGDHADHDPLVIAAFVAGDTDPSHARDARALLRECSACAALATDLRGIAAAVRAESHWTPLAPARAAFTLDVPTAERASRGRWWRSLLRPLAATSALRPASGALAALGVAGLLLAVIPGTVLMPTSSAEMGGGAPVTVASNGVDSGTGELAPADLHASDDSRDFATASGAKSTAAIATAGASPAGGTPGGADAAKGGSGDGRESRGAAWYSVRVRLEERAPLVALSVAFLVAGVGLLVLRRFARRHT